MYPVVDKNSFGGNHKNPEVIAAPLHESDNSPFILSLQTLHKVRPNRGGNRKALLFTTYHTFLTNNLPVRRQ